MNSRKVHLHMYHISRYYDDDDGDDNLMIVVHRKEEKKIHSECCSALSLSFSLRRMCLPISLALVLYIDSSFFVALLLFLLLVSLLSLFRHLAASYSQIDTHTHTRARPA